ncbi:MAG: hypothetical protein WCF29_13885 [Pseudolabrys sp.]
MAVADLTHPPDIPSALGHKRTGAVHQYAINGAFTLETIKLFFIGLPVLAGGLWIGIKLYGRLDDAAFRKVILWLLLLSGVGLLVPLLLPR